MSRGIEIAVFVALALSIHVMLFGLRPTGGVEAGGVDGDATISIEGATSAITEMVEQWERPVPQIPQPTNAPFLPDPLESLQPPNLELPEAPRADLKIAALPTLEPDELSLDIPQPPPPPTEPQFEVEEAATQQPDPLSPPPKRGLSELAPESSPRPSERPERRVKKEPEPQPEAAEKADQPSAGRAAQKAAGTGGGAQAGNSGSAQTTTASTGKQKELEAIWGAKIRSRIERAKRYPRGAREPGQVSLTISIGSDGRLLAVNVVRSSGNLELDQAAVAAVRRASRFPAAPRGLAGDSFTFSLSVMLQRN
ncbi:energy transducer TonB family protein [Ruegeria profundi]|uniref:TonB C-terminal domain-containing protein n=1 Tax=Ruegeria profundi TaxID=1685378 RepID=A0A0X3U2P8_9RHOB|nr:TonB family protein [Ruegeria profundi]KUJ81146.1 hypothetical protein AVO44_04575 [Ruegeria profundi]